MTMLETPSRILRRIEALEAQDSDLPSLPSFPAFEDSGVQSLPSSSIQSLSPKDLRMGEDQGKLPYHSTPAPASSHTTRSTIRPPQSTSSSATRFANSMRGSASTTRRIQQETEGSFEVSEILPTRHDSDTSSSASVPDIYFPPERDDSEEQIQVQFQDDADQELSPSNAFDSISRSPIHTSDEQHRTPVGRKYDYSVSLRSEPKPSPNYPNRNVSIRKPVLARTRTPSLSRTTPSPTSASSNSTPRSTYSPMTRGVVSPTPPREELSESGDVPEEVDPVPAESFHLEEALSPVADERSLCVEDEVEPDERQLQSEPQDSSREPTFSSEEQPQSSGSSRGGTPFPNAFSSPLTKTLSTPVALRAVSAPVNATPMPGVAEDLATPYNRRRSFLLSLVHSTTRPRMSFPTPHPRVRAAATRPRVHPLSQAWTPSPVANLTTNPSSGGSSQSHSPHDRLSFISTASSHDLTVHPRANASFDPAMGAKGVGRFNAVKLNTYLHGLNRRLQEENEMLVRRLRMHGEEVEMDKMADDLEREGFKGVEEAVLEEVEAMRDELEVCERERDTANADRETMNEQVEALRNEMMELKNELDAEREGRRKDKERWKERMAEVESGVESVIKELERRLEEAERDARKKVEAEESARELQERCNALEEDLDMAGRRAEKAEDALANSSDLGAEIKQANDRAAEYREEVRMANERATNLERRLLDAEQEQEHLKAASDDQLAELDAELRHSLEAQQSAEAHALELEEEIKAADGRIEELEAQLTTAREKALGEADDMLVTVERLTEDAARAAEAARQMEDALEESERKMIADEEELASLRARIVQLERELETRRERSRGSEVAGLDDSRSPDALIPDVNVEQLEAELDDAHREIARLSHMLLESPTRRAIDKAKDTRIELLEREKDELSERVRALRTMAASSPWKSSGTGASSPTPHRQVLTLRTPKTPGGPLKEYSWLHGNSTVPSPSPLIAQVEHLQQVLNLANDSIDEKVDKLEEAGMDIVGLTEKLEDARARIITLEEEVARFMRREDRRLQRLGRVRCSKCGSQVNLSKLIGSGDGDQSSMELSSKFLASDPPTPPSKTTEALRVALQTVNSQLSSLRSQWENEKKDLLGEKAVLQDAAHRLNVELGLAKDKAKQALERGRQDSGREAKVRTNVETELGKAKSVVNDLEDALKDERLRLRSLSTEQSRMAREKEGILIQLQRAQSDLDDVKVHLDKAKRENRQLEAELRATATLDQKARLLETKVSENQNFIKQLRDDRESLAADHADLQSRYVEASAQVNRLRRELAVSQTSHDERRRQLDVQVNEIAKLHHELSQQAHELERIESEKNKAQADRSGIVRTVASLESDLKRVRSDAETLGRDLGELKTERDRMETRHQDELGKAYRAQKQLYAQFRLANEQLEAQREKTQRAIADLEGHVCQSNEQEVDQLRIRHKNECKGLMVQIRYLKAKFTRESVFRADLGYQKHYLLGMLASFEKSEKQIVAAVARIGFPSQSPPPRKRRTLRTIAVAALFVTKARRASDIWREQSASKSAVSAALQEVRRRRIAGSLGYT